MRRGYSSRMICQNLICLLTSTWSELPSPHAYPSYVFLHGKRKIVVIFHSVVFVFSCHIFFLRAQHCCNGAFGVIVLIMKQRLQYLLAMAPSSM